MTDPTLFNPRTDTAVLAVDRPGAGVGRGGGRGAAGDGAAGGTAGRGDGDSGASRAAAVAALFTSAVVVRDLGDGQLEDRLRLLGCAKSRLAAMDAEAVAELARRRGEAGAADVLRDELRQSRSGAKREVKQAGRLAELPGTSQALADGAITPQHARLIAEAAEAAPTGAPIDEAELLEAAQREPADLFGRTVRDHVNRRCEDDLEERRQRQRAQRRLTFKQQPDGMFEMFGRFDPVAGSRIETALAAMANSLWHAEDAKNRATPQQRLADALELLLTRTGGDGKAKGAAQGVDLLVIADYDTVLGRLRDARLVDGTPLAPEELIRLACDATILPALFDRKGEPLWLGRGKRHASARQRAMLAERDGGCIGCGVSPNWCQAHHIRHWADGGPTDLDNLCLLCSHCHHHEVHERGADIVRGADGRLTLEHPDRRRQHSNGAAAGAGGVGNPAGRERLSGPTDPGANPDVNQPLRC